MEIKFEIIKRLGVISENDRSWKKELNLVRLERRRAQVRYPRLERSPDRMGKGATFTAKELVNLKSAS